MVEDMRSCELKAVPFVVNASVLPSTVDGSQLTVTRSELAPRTLCWGASLRAAGRAALLTVERDIRFPLLLISAANHVILGFGSA